MNTIRQNIAYTCFSISSLFRGLGKMVITKEKSIVVDALTLPGWFILDECIIHHIQGTDGKLKNGFVWHYWPMPDEYCEQMQKLKRG